MRPIKFRAKSLKSGEWIIGSYVHDEEWAKDYIFRLQKVGAFYQLVKYEVDIKTVGEFTGLHDKDGKDIWEGDIILCKRKGNLVLYKVYVNDETKNWSIVSLDEDKDLEGLYDYHFECEVLGDIYSNQELLK